MTLGRAAAERRAAGAGTGVDTDRTATVTGRHPASGGVAAIPAADPVSTPVTSSPKTRGPAGRAKLPALGSSASAAQPVRPADAGNRSDREPGNGTDREAGRTDREAGRAGGEAGNRSGEAEGERREGKAGPAPAPGPPAKAPQPAARPRPRKPGSGGEQPKSTVTPPPSDPAVARINQPPAG